MPFVTIKLVGKLSHQQKADLAKQVTDVVVKVTKKDPKYVSVLIEETSGENWAMEGELFG